MLDIEKIKQLVEMMVDNDLVEISLRDGEKEVSLRRPIAGEGEVVQMVPAPVAAANPGASATPEVAAPTPPQVQEEQTEQVTINSPMVGTFYSAPDPNSPLYAEVGTHVNPDTVVCIVEAMKVFNEIKAEVAGTVEKTLVKNEEAVEYAQPLFVVRPD